MALEIILKCCGSHYFRKPSKRTGSGFGIGGRDADHAVAGFVQGVGFHQKPKQKMLLRI